MSYSDILRPRRDVLSEDGIEGIIDLTNLADLKRRKLEARPADFFSLTYPTADARRVMETGDRRQFFEIARGSALECGAIQDVLEVCGALSSQENTEAKKVLDRIVAMLTILGQRGYSVREAPPKYMTQEFDTDSDSDSEKKQIQCGLPE